MINHGLRAMAINHGNDPQLPVAFASRSCAAAAATLDRQLSHAEHGTRLFLRKSVMVVEWNG